MAVAFLRKQFILNVFKTLENANNLKSINSLKLLTNSNRFLRVNSSDRTQVNEKLIENYSDEEREIEQKRLKQFFNVVNNEIIDKQNDRHFAVIHIYGQQHLVKPGDMIYCNKAVPVDVGDRIKIEKCLAAGNETITLFGRPLLDRDFVHVEMTCIEKTMTHTVNNLKMIQRQNRFRRWHFKRFPLTMFRINEIKICHKVNETQAEIQ